MCYIPDALDHFARHDAEQEAALEKYPVCCECGQHITDEKLAHINDECMHLKCFKKEYVKDTEDFVGVM